MLSIKRKIWRGAPRVLAASVLALATPVITGLAAANPVRVTSVRVISKTPHLPHTTACLDAADGPPATDVEPTLAVNPVQPADQIAAWWTGQTGFSRLAVAGGYAVTHNGGKAWRAGVPQHVDSCTGRPRYSVAGAHDEWVTFAADGRRAYMVFESGRHLAPPGSHLVEGGNTNTIWLYTSTDGGRTWGQPAPIVKASLATGGPDQPRLAVDPTRDRTLYAFWRQIPPKALTGGDIGGAPAYFARSTDGGRTWSSPRRIFTPPQGGVPEGPLLQHPYVLANGTVVDVFDETNFFNIDGLERPATVMAIRSRDHGRTWSRPVAIARHSPLPFFTDPDNDRVKVIGTAASSAIGPDGALYVAWTERRGPDGLLRIFFARSRDGGGTWSRARQVGRVDTAIIGASMAVAGDGSLGVMYYDAGADKAGDHFWTTSVVLAYSRDGGAHWRTRRLAGPFNLAAAPAEGQDEDAGPRPFSFIGDYFGFAGLPHGFAAAFTMARPKAIEGPTDIFYARATLPRVHTPHSVAKSFRGPAKWSAVLSAPVRHVRAGGVRFAYRIMGSGPPLLLIAGADATMATQWDPAELAQLAAHHRVITYDHRGVGLSQGDVSHLSIGQLADDAAHLVSALHIGRVDVWGQSMGGFVAQELAIRHPRLVARLVLTSTSAGAGHWVPPVVALPPYAGTAGAPRIVFTPGAAGLRAERAFEARTALWRPHEPLSFAAHTAEWTAVVHFLAAPAAGAWEALPQVRGRTFVAGGLQDVVLPIGNSYMLASRLPDATLHVYPSSHFFYVQDAAQFMPDVLRFLDK